VLDDQAVRGDRRVAGRRVYFESVGKQLGFDTVIKYARLLGLGDRVGYNIAEEQPGSLPLFPPKYGGVAHMSSFGGGIRITPLQLASLAATLANGGTQYYVQYPRTTDERLNFTPRVRRQLDIAPMLPAGLAGTSPMPMRFIRRSCW
jgi:penicillin-binding protein 2